MSEIKKAGRPLGVKNKKMGVRLKDLCSILNPETVIPLSKDFVSTIQKINSSVIVTTESLTPAEEKPKIDFIIT